MEELAFKTLAQVIDKFYWKRADVLGVLISSMLICPIFNAFLTIALKMKDKFCWSKELVKIAKTLHTRHLIIDLAYLTTAH